MYNLVIQSFGRENEYKRAILTILSFYAYVNADKSNNKVLLFTDQPNYFNSYLEGLPVHYVLLTPEKIKTMRGQIDFLHRMKIAVIEEAFNLAEGPILYADSDTFFTADPILLAEKVSEETCFMHEMEYAFKDAPQGPTFEAFKNLISRQDFTLSDGSRITITPNNESWNAGVMFFHPSHARFIPDVYTLTDQFFPPTQNHASEQYAFSIMLQQNTQLQVCDSIIYHYWYRVKKKIIDHFLSEQLTVNWANLPLQSKLNRVREWTATLPQSFEQHQWTIEDHAVQAFNRNEFGEGYKWATKAFIKAPYQSAPFLKNVLYHLKRQLTHK